MIKYQEFLKDKALSPLLTERQKLLEDKEKDWSKIFTREDEKQFIELVRNGNLKKLVIVEELINVIENAFKE